MSESEGEMEIQKIVGERHGANRGLEYLVRWKGFSKKHDSWEPVKSLKHAVEAIAEFKSKLLGSRAAKPRRRSKSRSRSRSHITGRSKSRSPARSKKGTSLSRSSRGRESGIASLSVTNTASIKQGTVTEAVSDLLNVQELKTESVTTSADFAKETCQSTVTSETTAAQTSSNVDDSLKSACATDNLCKISRDNTCGLQRIRDCCAGLVQSDYPAIVVLVMVVVIMLTFLLQQNIDFHKFWDAFIAMLS